MHGSMHQSYPLSHTQLLRENEPGFMVVEELGHTVQSPPFALL